MESNTIKKILVVDDEDLISKALALRLKSEGYAVDTATDGKSAVEAFVNSLKGTQYSLILLDIMMPNMNGIEVLRAIREIENKDVDIVITHKVPVILISALNKPMILRNQAPWDAYVQKPYNYPELMALIKKQTSTQWPNDMEEPEASPTDYDAISNSFE